VIAQLIADRTIACLTLGSHTNVSSADVFVLTPTWRRHIDEWIPLAEFFERKFQTQTSHGMCLACSEEMKAKMKSLRAA
jgi:hypothetical protein